MDICTHPIYTHGTHVWSWKIEKVSISQKNAREVHRRSNHQKISPREFSEILEIFG
jgi:hypothetical protein